jgi:predicted short-subunit dehydrogenase-like oxidoreductase (DUF2520 family)
MGKLGQALGRALSATGVEVTRVGWRERPRRGLPSTKTVLCCVRDAILPEVPAYLLRSGLEPGAVVVHVAGAYGRGVLGELGKQGVGIAQMHPFLSVAETGRDSFAGIWFLVDADRKASPVVRALVERLLGRLVSARRIDRRAYHLAASLAANGAVALLMAAHAVLGRAGIDGLEGRLMLTSLLGSVVDNVERLGIAEALTGPIRRGDVATVAAHREWMRENQPETLALHRELSMVLLGLSRGLGEASSRELGRLQKLFESEAPTPGSPFVTARAR